ncbi:hypothetical protein JCGZ_18303 [Jatropha curcas]|uniref:Uncharacterized protein n=1 Tax=Jatropha curcas TaxID=180498 RepID=A0A067JZS8_JATCU|nr:hypothetical protein JCGZ_18303 [Jatropha curcas]
MSALTTAFFSFGQIADVMDNAYTTCATSGIMYAACSALFDVTALPEKDEASVRLDRGTSSGLICSLNV